MNETTKCPVCGNDPCTCPKVEKSAEETKREEKKEE